MQQAFCRRRPHGGPSARLCVRTAAVLGAFAIAGGTILLPARASAADEIELTDGSIVTGTITERTDEYVKVRVSIGSSSYEKKVYSWQIRAVRTGEQPRPEPAPGPKPEPAPRPGPKPTPEPTPLGPPAATDPPAGRTVAEVKALIEQAGRTRPDWWDATEMNQPKTLDLTWKQVTKSWNPNTNLGAYTYDSRRMPDRWKPLTKLLHEVVELNKNDAQRNTTSLRALAFAYQSLLCDFPRAAYWRLQAKRAAADTGLQLNDITDLAECYVRLGCPQLAEQEVARFASDTSGDGRIIRLLGKVDKVDRALAMANAQFKSSSAPAPDGAALGAADVCRYVGRIEEAIRLYEKVAAMTRGGRGLKRNQDRAQDAAEALKAFKGFDPARATDGTYTAAGAGFRGPVNVQVVVKGGRIESVQVASHREDWFAAALTDVPRQIVERQSMAGIDAVSGATCSSEGVYNGVARALGQSMK